MIIHLDAPDWFDTMDTIELSYKGVFITANVLVITWKHLSQHLNKIIHQTSILVTIIES